MTHFPGWFIDVYAVAFCAVFVLAFTLGLLVLMFGLGRAVAWMASMLIKESKSVRLLVWAVWWRANGNRTPERMLLKAVGEQARWPLFRAHLARALHDAEVKAQSEEVRDAD